METRSALRLSRVLVLAFIPLVSCGQSKTLDEEVELLYRKTVPVISKTGLDSALSVDSTVLVLDCRALEEYEVSHISSAQLADYGSFEVNELKTKDLQRPIVVYCSIGYRSERIGEKLQEAGYTNVHNLYGGILEWKNKGGVVVNSNKDTTEKVHTYNKQWSRFLEKGEKVF